MFRYPFGGLHGTLNGSIGSACLALTQQDLLIRALQNWSRASRNNTGTEIITHIMLRSA